MARMAIRRLALLALPLLLPLGSATQQCYFPDGTKSSDTPCSSDDSYQTFCCPSSATCLLDPGPICQTSGGGYERGTCTVKDWGSGACPKFCLADTNDNTLDRCTAQVSNGNFCCGYDADADLCSCATNNNTFPLYAYSSIKVAQTAASSTSTSSSSSSSSSASASTAATTTGSSAASAATTGTATASPTSSASSTSDSGLTTGAKIGVGIAVPLGVIAIGVLAFLAWRMRRKSKRTASAYPRAELPSQGHQGYYDPPPNEVKYAHEGQVPGYGHSPHQAPSELYAPPAGQHEAYEMPTNPRGK